MGTDRRGLWFLPAAAAVLVLVSGNLVRLGWNAELTVLLGVCAAALVPLVLVNQPRTTGWQEVLRAGPGRVPLPLWLFTALAVVSALEQRTEAGYQNALVYVVFLASIVVAAAWAVPGTPVRLLWWIVTGAVLGASGYLVTVAVAGAGSDGFYLARGVGVVAWIGMVAAVPLAASSRKAILACAVLVVACALSLSRTSTAVCLLLALAIVLRPGKRVPVRLLLVWTASLVGCAALAVTFFTPLRDRFLRNDNESIAGLPIGSSGRVNIWREVWDSIQESPLYGHGTGSAQRLVSDAFGESYIAHPHNDYLRLWHDFGIAGLALWLAGMWLLGSGAFRRWRSAGSSHDQAAHLAAVLALVGLAASITTGNMLIQVFVAVPIGIVIGTSLRRDPTLDLEKGGDRSRSLTRLQPSERTAPGR